MILNAAEKNALDSIKILLQICKIPVTKQTLTKKLWYHPDFPSLASMSDTLEELKIANIATRLSMERLIDIPLPAVAYLNIDGGIFATIRSVSDHKIEWHHTRRGWQNEDLNRFNEKWNGVTLLIEPDEQSGEDNYKEKRKNEIITSFRYPFIWSGVLICLIALLVLDFQNYPLKLNNLLFLLLSTKATGLALSSILVWYSIDLDNPILRKICQLNSKVNCQNILKSKGSKLLDLISWSEFGFLYFIGGFVFLQLSLIIKSVDSSIQYLFILSCFGLPYTLYSIYYQAFIAKAWCLLCTLIQFLLWIEFLILYQIWLPSSLIISIPTTCLVVFSFLVAPIIWTLVKPWLQKSSQHSQLHKELSKIKFDSNYVKGLQEKQRILPPIFEGMKVATIGNQNADFSLVVIANPFCESCARLHHEIHSLIENYSTFKCHFIWGANNEPGDKAGIVARKILSLPIAMMPNAIKEWYEDPRFEIWNNKTHLPEDNEEGYHQLNLHIRWCDLAGINKAPFIFFNNIELPQHYNISELEKLSRVMVDSRFDQIT